MLLPRYALVLGFLVSDWVFKKLVPEVVFNDNPMLWVSFSLFLGLVAYRVFSKRPIHREVFVFLGMRKLFKKLELASVRAFFGFLIASVGVALSLALGFLRLEAPHLMEVEWIDFLLGSALQLLNFIMWLLLVDVAFRILDAGVLSVLVMGIVFLESLGTQNLGYASVILAGAVALAMASYYALWTKATMDSPKRTLCRQFWTLGFLGSLYFLFGQWRGGVKTQALFDLSVGPVSLFDSELLRQGILGQPVFIVLLFALGNWFFLRGATWRHSS